MVWTCISCAKSGDRTGSDPSFCYRQGLGGLKGQLLCCNCAKNTVEWEGYDLYGCENCLESSFLSKEEKRGIRILRHKDRMRVCPMVTNKDKLRHRMRENIAILDRAGGNLGTRRFGAHGDTQEGSTANCGHFSSQTDPKLRNASRIVVSEFDRTLFRTPTKPSWWQFKGYEEMIQSLVEPCVPQHPDSSWWNEDVVAELMAHRIDPKTWTSIISYRSDPFSGRIKEMLKGEALAVGGCKVDEVRLRPLCPVCSPVGLSRLGTAGYRHLSGNLCRKPSGFRQTHFVVTLSHLVANAPEVKELVIYAPSFLDDEYNDQHEMSAEALNLLFWSTPELAIKIVPVVAAPHPAGSPSPEELQAMLDRPATVKAYKRRRRLAHIRQENRERRHKAKLANQARLSSSKPQLNWVEADLQAGRRNTAHNYFDNHFVRRPFATLSLLKAVPEAEDQFLQSCDAEENDCTMQQEGYGIDEYTSDCDSESEREETASVSSLWSWIAGSQGAGSEGLQSDFSLCDASDVSAADIQSLQSLASDSDWKSDSGESEDWSELDFPAGVDSRADSTARRSSLVVTDKTSMQEGQVSEDGHGEAVPATVQVLSGHYLAACLRNLTNLAAHQDSSSATGCYKTQARLSSAAQPRGRSHEANLTQENADSFVDPQLASSSQACRARKSRMRIRANYRKGREEKARWRGISEEEEPVQPLRFNRLDNKLFFATRSA